MVRNELQHHGITGMHWGKRYGPPYPLTADRMNTEERKNNIVSKYASTEIKKHGKPDAKTNYTVKRSSSSSTTNSTTSISTGGSGGGGGSSSSSNEDSYAKRVLKNFQAMSATESGSSKKSGKGSSKKSSTDKKAKEEEQKLKEELAEVKKKAQKEASRKKARQSHIDRLLGTRLSMVSSSKMDVATMKKLREDLRKLSDIL